MDELTVRRATADDLPALLALFEGLDRLQAPWRVFPPRASLVREMEDRYRSALGAADSAFLVAELEARVVGMALAAVITPSSYSDRHAVELSSVFVHPAARGRGAGKALVREAARFAARSGVGRITLKTFARNEGALVFWERLGFEPRIVQMTVAVGDLADGLSDGPTDGAL